MFAVFLKGVFQDWWLNRPEDIGWVDRTIAAKGWNSFDVKVIWFDLPPRGEVFRFNDDFSVSIMEKKFIEFEGQEKEVWSDKEMRVGRVHYEQGRKVADIF